MNQQKGSQNPCSSTHSLGPVSLGGLFALVLCTILVFWAFWFHTAAWDHMEQTRTQGEGGYDGSVLHPLSPHWLDN